MKAGKKHKRKTGILVGVCITVLIVTALLYFVYGKERTFSGVNPQNDDGLMESDLARIADEHYNSVMISMRSTKGISEEDFSYYRAMEAFIASHTILNTKELSQYLDEIINSGNQVTTICLGLDPELLWIDAGQKKDRWNEKLEKNLYFYVAQNPDISFEISLPNPYIDYWTGLEEDKLDTLLTVYQTLINQLAVYPNVKAYFPGYEPWIIKNPGNYEDSLLDTGEMITRSVILNTWSGKCYQITPENEVDIWTSFRRLIESEKSMPGVYPDLSKWHMVFFGDSVLANYSGSSSIPGCMAGVSHISFDNYAVGGSGAVGGFLAASDTFLNARQELPENRKLCFLVNYGLNDYFEGMPIEDPSDPYNPETYKGSLRSGISGLQEKFPEAEYIIMSPTRIGAFQNGTEITNEDGNDLETYIEAAKEVAEEMDLYFIDNYHNSVITAENKMNYIVDDGVHPNENGRFEIAIQIVNLLDEI